MTDHDDDREIPKAPGDFSDLTPEQHRNVEWDADTAIQNAQAAPGMAKVGAMLAAIVEDALSPALAGRRVQTCMHAIDQSYVPDLGFPVKGTGRPSKRRVYLCTQHPERLICDNPASKVGPGCMAAHVMDKHRHELHVRCFVCHDVIPQDQITPVFAVITLRTPLYVYDMHDRAFMFKGDLRTMPITYLCVRHSGAVQLPIRMEWQAPPNTGQ